MKKPKPDKTVSVHWTAMEAACILFKAGFSFEQIAGLFKLKRVELAEDIIRAAMNRRAGK